MPPECNNKSLVQVRWISKQNSGAGSGHTITIDNLSIINDVAPPVNDTNYPKISSTLSTDVDFLDEINKTNKTYFVLLLLRKCKPSAIEIKAGQNGDLFPTLQSLILTIID